MSEFLIRFGEGFNWGYSPITQIGEKPADVGINFGILKLRAGDRYSGNAAFEEALLLMSGSVMFRFGDTESTVSRSSIFEENPFVLHHAAGSSVRVIAQLDSELAIFQVPNSKEFSTMLFDSKNMLESEHRDKGLLDDTSYRIVRTVFDLRNRPNALLVLGEVINFPGRWSSYPPHHHPQPEIYHYRFTHPHGYGHCEIGEQVLKVREFDTVKILDLRDHSQVAAPGYGMYYLWVIRHLAGNPYTIPEFTEEHRWLKSPDAEVWRPSVMSSR